MQNSTTSVAPIQNESIADLDVLSAWLWQEDVDLQAIFCQDKNSLRLLEQVAGNKELPEILLEQLSYHPSATIRIAVAENPATPPHVLEMLISDSDVDVRYALAENHNLSDKMLGQLTNDEHPYVASRAQTTLTRLSNTSVSQVLHVAFGTRLRAKDLLALLA